DVVDLERTRDTQPTDFMRRHAGNIFTFILDPPTGGLHAARKQVVESRLTRAVGPDDGECLMTVDVEIHIGYCGHAAEPFADPRGLKNDVLTLRVHHLRS